MQGKKPRVLVFCVGYFKIVNKNNNLLVLLFFVAGCFFSRLWLTQEAQQIKVLLYGCYRKSLGFDNSAPTLYIHF